MATKDWKKIRENCWASNTFGVIEIQTIPNVDLKTMKVTGYTYSFGTSKKHMRYKRFKNKLKALQFAKAFMRKN